MEIQLNGKTLHTQCKTLFQLKHNQNCSENTVIILNGFQISSDMPLHENDQLFFISKDHMPSEEYLEDMMAARHTPGVHSKLKQGKVAIAGLGGLGSAIAIMLARIGVGQLLLVDFDTVEPSNLNRQSYYLSHLGMKKVDAMKHQLANINPFIQVETVYTKVSSENVCPLFKEYDVICEAFDDPKAKAMLVNTALEKLTDIKIVASSGMAGYFSSNAIITTRKFSRLFLCGDMQNESKQGSGLMAPRVQICAGHQANMTLRLLLGITEA